MDLSTVRTAADSVCDYHFPRLNDLGRTHFRFVCGYPENSKSLAPGVTAGTGSGFEIETVARPARRLKLFDTGSVRHGCNVEAVLCKACASSLFDPHASYHSRMDKTAFLQENKTENRNSCASSPLMVDKLIVAKKRERNSMKPLMRQTFEKRGQDVICQETPILVKTSTLKRQPQYGVLQNGGGR